MANDWIKIRVLIDRDPKVWAMAYSVSENPRFCQWLGGPVGKSFSNACDHVTVTVTRDIIVSSLVRFWGVALERGKRDGDDLIVSRCNLTIVDEIAGVPGLGKALEEVGWLVTEENGTIRLPQFLIENTPADERQQEKQREKSRESSRRYREKQKKQSQDGDGHVTVTGDEKMTPREEEIRGDKNSIEPSAGAEGLAEQTDKSLCPPDAPTEFVFPLEGKGKKTWTLMQSKLDEYIESYPGLDVVREIRKARQWARDNPGKRKTETGMIAFLTRWLNREQNRNGGSFIGQQNRRRGPEIGPGQSYDPNHGGAGEF